MSATYAPRTRRTPRVNKASEKTLKFLSDLVNERQASDQVATTTVFLIEVTQRAWDGKVREDDPEPLSQTQASKLIENFQDMPRRSGREPITTPGVFEFGGAVYVVDFGTRSGRLYARVYSDPNGETQVAHWNDPTSVKATYAPGMMRELREVHRATDERVRQIGTLIHRCVDCNAELSAPESIARGKGPVCASK